MCFLRGLNDNFAMLRSQILLLNPLPLITTVFSMVIEHERQNGLVPPQDESSSLVNLADGKRFSGKGKNNWTPIGFKKDSKSSVNSSVVDDSDGKTETGESLGKYRYFSGRLSPSYEYFEEDFWYS